MHIYIVMEEFENLEAILEWHIESGVLDIVGEEPFSLKTAHSNEKEKIVTTRPATTYLAQATNQSCLASREISEKASTIEELNEAIKNFDGCAIKLTAAQTVLGSGKINAKIMIIGEAPSAEEDRKGLAFTGENGKFLDLMIESLGISREDTYVSYILPWRPPGNRTPTEAEIAICLPFIKKQIELVSPEHLIFMGGSVANAVLDNSDAISQLRGKILEYKQKNKENIKSITTFAPSYLMLNPMQKAKTWSDLIRLRKIFS